LPEGGLGMFPLGVVARLPTRTMIGPVIVGAVVAGRFGSMRSFTAKRAFAMAAGLAIIGSLAAVALAGPASAKSSNAVTCAHLNAPAPKQHVTKLAVLSGCTAPKATGGLGRVNALVTTPGSGNATIKWNKAGSTTTFDYKLFAETNPDERETQACPAHTKEFVVVGQVTGGTGAAGRLLPIGQPVSAEVCVNAKRVINEPGNRVKI